MTRATKHLFSTLAALSVLTVSCPSEAQEGGGARAGAEADLSSASVGTGPEGDEQKGALLLAGKLGGNKELNDLGLFVAGAIEVGYVFGGTKRRIGALLDVAYTAPLAEGDAKDARLTTGEYHWELRQKMLTLQPTFLYRLTRMVEPIVPYAGIGPRIFLLQSVTRGKSGDATFPDTKEQSTKFGLGIPLGAEYRLGPGGVLLEVAFQWAPITHETTGEASLAGFHLWLGYRALL
jgi:hypothetical protein